MEVPDDPSLNITDAITVVVWVYYKKNPDEWPAFVSKWSIDIGYMMWQRANLNIAFGVWDEAGNDYTAGEIPLTEGWHHLVGVYDPSLSSDNVKLYVNGKQTGQTSDFTGKISTTTNPLYVGRVSNQYFSGIIAHVSIYNRALSSSEIKYLYHNPFDPIDPEHLVLWLNPAGIDVANSKWWDLSGKGNHGTIYGATEVKLVEDEVIVK